MNMTRSDCEQYDQDSAIEGDSGKIGKGYLGGYRCGFTSRFSGWLAGRNAGRTSCRLS